MKLMWIFSSYEIVLIVALFMVLSANMYRDYCYRLKRKPVPVLELEDKIPSRIWFTIGDREYTWYLNVYKNEEGLWVSSYNALYNHMDMQLVHFTWHGETIQIALENTMHAIEVADRKIVMLPGNVYRVDFY